MSDNELILSQEEVEIIRFMRENPELCKPLKWFLTTLNEHPELRKHPKLNGKDALLQIKQFCQEGGDYDDFVTYLTKSLQPLKQEETEPVQGRD